MKNCLSFLLCILVSVSVLAQPQKINRGLPFNPALKPFYHGVASGDPLSDKVIIWTRVTPEVDSTIQVMYFFATDTSFRNVVKTGTVKTDSTKDYTVKVDITDLQAGSTYYYYFSALGRNSLIGKTKTVPIGDNLSSQLRFAVVSCNNYEGGFFNAYSRIAERRDLDAILHLGDYIYEYAPGDYRNVSFGTGRSNLLPDREIINEADYRTRYSLYRLDGDLMRAHQQHPLICIWDDHEFTNDSYDTGAENHTAGTEGDWLTRKGIAKKVYFEWMPVRDNAKAQIYRKISYGTLLDLFLMDTRMDGRMAPPTHFDDVDNPVRKMISDDQFTWLTDGLANSNARWKVVGNQVILSGYNLGFAAGSTSAPPAPDPTNIVKIRSVEDLFVDDWRGHPTQRAQLIDTIKNRKVNNTIFITGDSHCSWAFDVTKVPTLYPNAATANMPLPSPTYNRLTGDGSVAVEFCAPGISSQNFDEVLPLTTAQGFQYQINGPLNLKANRLGFLDTLLGLPGNVYYNPHLKHVDLIQQGYMLLDLKKDSAQADWFYVNVLDSTSQVQTTGQTGPFATNVKAAQVLNATNRVRTTTAISKGKPALDIPAPTHPLNMVTSLNHAEIPQIIFSLHPNPARNFVLLNFGLASASRQVDIELVDIHGKRVKSLSTRLSLGSGNYVQEIEVSDLKTGIYFVKISTDAGATLRKLVVE